MIIDGMDKFSLAENKERKGFFFLANAPSTKEAATRLCDVLIATNVSQKLPETIYLGDKGLSVFVFGDDFDSPVFFQAASMAEQFGVCKVGPIAELENLQHPDIKIN